MVDDTTPEAASTRLGQALRQRPTRRVGPLDLFRAARRRWIAGDRIDVGALATELGIGRATAFRWVGSRDLLLGEIFWSLCEPMMDQIASETRGRGAQRVAAISERTIRSILAFRPLRRFIEQDAEFALRLLTSKRGPVQARVIQKMRELLSYEAERGTLALAINVETLAYLVVRMGESFVYADVISGQRVDPADAGLAVELLLSGKVDRAARRQARSLIKPHPRRGASQNTNVSRRTR